MYIVDHKIPKYLYKIRDVVLEDYLNWLSLNYNNITENKKRLAKNAVSCFILNLNVAMLKEAEHIGLSLSQTTYNKSRIINGKDTKRKVSYTYTKSLYNYLNLHNYGDLTVGGVSDFGMVDGVWCATDFSGSYLKIGIKTKTLYSKYVKKRETFDKLEDVLILRKKNSKFNERYAMEERLDSVLDFLNRFNELCRDKEVTLHGKRLDIQIYKIFNEDFNNGGRNHHNCNYQRESKNTRKDLIIEGSPTVCYDFKGFEPSIAYSMNQEVMEMDDPYYVEALLNKGYDPEVSRKLAKLVVIICLNVDSEKSAKLAINKAISDNLNVKSLFDKGKIPEETIPVQWVIDQIKDLHYIISHMFFTAKGLIVQNVGSAINDYILDHIMQNYKQLVVQVHDDFSIAEDYEDVLKEVMFKAYERVLGFSDNCKIEKEY